MFQIDFYSNILLLLYLNRGVQGNVGPKGDHVRACHSSSRQQCIRFFHRATKETKDSSKECFDDLNREVYNTNECIEVSKEL